MNPTPISNPPVATAFFFYLLSATMIIGGILAPILGPMICLGEPQGKCPWCGTKVSNVFNASSFDCHECGKRIDAHDRHFIKAA